MISKKVIKEHLKGCERRRTKKEIIEEIQYNINFATNSQDPEIIDASFQRIMTLLWVMGKPHGRIAITASHLLKEAK